MTMDSRTTSFQVSFGLDLNPQEHPYEFRSIVVDGGNVIGRRMEDSSAEEARRHLVGVVQMLSEGRSRIKVVLPERLLQSDRNKVHAEFIPWLKKPQNLLVIPQYHPRAPGREFKCCAQDEREDPCFVVAFMYSVSYELLSRQCIARSTYQDIINFFKTTRARHFKPSGKRQLPLDDLVCIFEAKRIDACILTDDRFRDMIKYVPSVKQFIYENRFSVQHEAVSHPWRRFIISFEKPFYGESKFRSILYKRKDHTTSLLSSVSSPSSTADPCPPLSTASLSSSMGLLPSSDLLHSITSCKSEPSLISSIDDNGDGGEVESVELGIRSI